MSLLTRQKVTLFSNTLTGDKTVGNVTF